VGFGVHTAVKMSLLFFSPEDGDSMFIRNVGTYLRVHTASQPVTTTLTGINNLLHKKFMVLTRTTLKESGLSHTFPAKVRIHIRCQLN
jgi:hypothetical protein